MSAAAGFTAPLHLLLCLSPVVSDTRWKHDHTRVQSLDRCCCRSWRLNWMQVLVQESPGQSAVSVCTHVCMCLNLCSLKATIKGFWFHWEQVSTGLLWGTSQKHKQKKYCQIILKGHFGHFLKESCFTLNFNQAWVSLFISASCWIMVTLCKTVNQ